MKKQILFSFAFLLLLASCYTKEDAAYENGIYNSNTAYDGNTEFVGDEYIEYIENPFVEVSEQPISTFSIDADGASYANVRRFITQDNQLPPLGAIRTEELINYFDLDYDFENSAHPISLNGEVSVCPWNTENKLVRIGMKGKDIPQLPCLLYTSDAADE